MASKVVKKNVNAKAVSKPAASAASSTDNSIICAVLCYFLVGIIWYFADENMKKSAHAKYHTKQALTLLIVDIILWIVMWILAAILIWIPFIGWALISILSVIVWLFVVVLWIFGIIYAATGKDKPLPIIGKFAEKFKF